MILEPDSSEVSEARSKGMRRKRGRMVIERQAFLYSWWDQSDRTGVRRRVMTVVLKNARHSLGALVTPAPVPDNSGPEPRQGQPPQRPWPAPQCHVMQLDPLS